MNIILVEYINTKQFGKLAHFVDKDGNNIYSKILYDKDRIYYQELTDDELNAVKDDIES